MTPLAYLRVALATIDEDRKLFAKPQGAATITITEDAARWLVAHVESLERGVQTAGTAVKPVLPSPAEMERRRLAVVSPAYDDAYCEVAVRGGTVAESRAAGEAALAKERRALPVPTSAQDDGGGGAA